LAFGQDGRRRAPAAGFGPFDSAVARNCVMYFRDLPQALAGIRGMLRGGGRLVLSLYGPREREPFHDVALTAVERRQTLRDPLPQYARAFRVDSAGVATALAAAGFGQIEHRVVPTLRTYPSLALALARLRHSPSLGELLAALDPSARDDAWLDIAAGLRRFESGAGLRIPGEQVVIAARA
jgi:SAM-dependent methyltransferase